MLNFSCEWQWAQASLYISMGETPEDLLKSKTTATVTDGTSRAAKLGKLTSVTICYNFKIFSNISEKFQYFYTIIMEK